MREANSPVGSLPALGRASLTVASASGLVGVAAVLRDVVIGRRLGLGASLDGWSLALAVLVLVTSTFVSAVSAALVPAMSRAAGESGSRDGSSRRLASEALVIAAIACLVVAAAAWVTAPALADLMSDDADTRVVTSDTLRRLSVLAIGSLLLRGTSSALLHARHRFALVALLPLLSASLVAGYAAVRTDVAPVGLATIHGLGVAVEALVLLLAVRVMIGLTRPSLGGVVRTFRAMSRPFLLAALAALVFGINPVVDLWFAGWIDEGEVGRLALAARIPLAGGGLVAAAIATPAFPRFADAAGDVASDRFSATVRSVLRPTFKIAIGLALGIALVSLPLAMVLFAGSELDASAARSVGLLQVTYSFTIVPYVLGAVTARALHALDQQQLVLRFGIAGCVANIALDAVLAPLLGLHGIAAATALVYAATFSLMWRSLRDGGSAARART
ncbi:MAG: lipid II flippase MurJ [Ilumatobacter sp.]|uniref:lipid II flippase MurJ n=1 Tax=Ilumatobacter sp. TaxID=1967498 RepID=UPI00263005F1|nr:lipid II flippase MurJ [Ilumatobacter sp.]MDJ0768631.1 lipid II flippase MurJ [Ilumatobacter sp.]